MNLLWNDNKLLKYDSKLLQYFNPINIGFLPRLVWKCLPETNDPTLAYLAFSSDTKKLNAECHYTECHYAECRYAECRYAECRGAFVHGVSGKENQFTDVGARPITPAAKLRTETMTASVKSRCAFRKTFFSVNYTPSGVT